ncbi:MAG: hypothetical protein QM817_04360 [Archangium sp.]
MSRINSMFKQATQAAQQTVSTAKKEVAKVEEKAKRAVNVGMTDGFDGGASKLYDAGANKSGRTTKENKVTFGIDSKFGDSQNSDHLVSGVQLRNFTQAAGTVLSAGADAFVGGKQETVSTDLDGTRRESLVKMGAEVGVQGFVGTVNGVKAGAQLGIEVLDKTTTRSDLGNGLQLKDESSIRGFWGARARGGAQLGTVSGAEVELFAGAKGLGEKRGSITDGQNELAGVAGRFGTMVGVGVIAHVEGGYDVDNHQARVSVDGGAALIVGAQVGGDVTIGGKDE